MNAEGGTREVEGTVVRCLRRANEADERCEPAGVEVDHALDPVLELLRGSSGPRVADAALHRIDEIRLGVLASLLSGANDEASEVGLRLTVHLLAEAMRRLNWYSTHGLGDLPGFTGEPGWDACLNVVTQVAVRPGFDEGAGLARVLGPLLTDADDRALRSAAWALLNYAVGDYGPVPDALASLVTAGARSDDPTVAYHARYLARHLRRRERRTV